MDEKIKRLIKWFMGEKAAPYTLEIWPTFRCNLSCVFCAHDLQRKTSETGRGKEISSERWLEILDEAYTLGVKEIRLVGGGEPTNIKDSFLLMGRVKEYGMAGSITTNGTLFDEASIKDLVKSGWDRIEFSIDGPNAEINDYLRGKTGTFDKMLRTLKLFDDYKKKLKKNKPDIFFSTVVTNLNFNKIDQMLDLARSVGCKQIILLSLNMDTPFCEKLKLNKEQLKRFVASIPFLKDKSKKMNVDLCIDMVCYQEQMSIIKKEGFILPNISQKFRFLEAPCFEPWYYMQIKHDGRVSPCCCGFCNKNEKERMHTASLESMWYGEHLNAIRDSLFKKELIGDCSFCNSLNLYRSNHIRNELISICLQNNPGEHRILNKIKEISDKIFNQKKLK